MNFEHARREFEAYLDNYDREDDKVKLKIVHTQGVVRCAWDIGTRMGLSWEDRELAALIALLHDIGRFEQLKRYDSFMPETMDHARYGAQLLFGADKMIRRFVKEDTWDELIRVSIEKHSDFKLEGITDERTLLHAKLIRDADKLDNCRVKLYDPIEVFLGESAHEAGKGKISPKVWEACMRRESVLSRDRRTKVDFWASYVAYFFDVNFPETFAIIKEHDYVARTVEKIPYQDPDTYEKMHKLQEMVQEFVDENAKKCHGFQEKKSDSITTYTKIAFNPLNPRKEDISIRDIAHALSMMTRANGHFPEFYSVGQHCIHCAREALAQGQSRRLALACLLHDASEAYLADITRPVKKQLEQYQKAEEKLLGAVYEKYLGSPLTWQEELEVKRIDDTLLYHEFYHYMGERLMEEAPEIQELPVFETRDFKDVEEEYLKLFWELRQ